MFQGKCEAMGRNLNPNGLYCAYLRKSRKDMELEALGQGETLQRHDRQLRELAERLGVKISATYREIVSGDTIAERPEVRRLLDDVNAGAWAGVLVMDVDRLGRGDSIDQGVIMQSFLYSGTLIITPDKIYDPADDSDAEFFEIKLFFSRREYNMIKKRMQRGRVASILDGCSPGGPCPFGYERYKLPGRKGFSMRVVPEEAEIVRAMYAWYADGMDGQTVGANSIANRLNAMGVTTKQGNRFTPSAVKGILRNPTYLGKVQWFQRETVYRIEEGRRVKSRPRSDKYILVDGRHEAIVDQALFDRVQAIFAAHGKFPVSADGKIQNPFAGILKCGICGHSMRQKPDAGRGQIIIYCKYPGCPTASTYLPVVEDAALSVLASWREEFALKADDAPQNAADQAAAEAARARLQAQREALSARLERHYDLLERGIYSDAEFIRRRAEVQNQLVEIDKALKALDQKPECDPRAALVPQIATVLDTYRAAPDAETKNALLRTVFSKIIYHKTIRGLRNSRPGENLALEFHPRIPADF